MCSIVAMNRSRKSRISNPNSRPNGKSLVSCRTVAEGQLVRAMAPQRTRINNDPETVEANFKVTHKFSGVFLTTTGSGSAPTSKVFSMADLASLVPGGTSYWSRMRLEKCQIWLRPKGSEQPTLQVDVSSPTQGMTIYRDDGVLGQSYAKIGFRLGLSERMTFRTGADDNPLFTVSTPDWDQDAVEIVLLATLELVSPASTAI